MSSVTCHTSICGIIIISFHFYGISIHIIVICFGSDRTGGDHECEEEPQALLYVNWAFVCSLGTVLRYMCNTRLWWGSGELCNILTGLLNP
jgi:hypothetical protein